MGDQVRREVLVLVALPGVKADAVEAAIDDGDLVIAGTRVLPPELRTAVIHRLELPQGRFERRLRLPAGRYGAVHRATVDGCLLVTLAKAYDSQAGPPLRSADAVALTVVPLRGPSVTVMVVGAPPTVVLAKA